MGLMPYAWSKQAMKLLADGLRGEVGPQVHVSLIMPGLVQSRMTAEAAKAFGASEWMETMAMPAREAADIIAAGLQQRKVLLRRWFCVEWL